MIEFYYAIATLLSIGVSLSESLHGAENVCLLVFVVCRLLLTATAFNINVMPLLICTLDLIYDFFYYN